VKVAIKLRHGRRPQGGHLQRSHESFRVLLRQHQSMVFSIARRIVRDPSLAEEVAQDVFLQLHDELPALASEDHVVHWLRRVTVHRAIDQARRRLRRPQDYAAVSFAEPGFRESGVAEPATAAQETDPWMAARLRQRIESLPIVPRTVIVLRYQEELGPEEIAELLGMPVATVKSHLQRALKVLRARMQQRPIRGGAQRPAN
jgi:RNA polymerase sigma-70 factor (ECF subfamily)